jgi:integrase
VRGDARRGVSLSQPEAKRKQTLYHHLEEVQRATLRKAGVPYFPLYELRHTFATRLSTGGVADHFVTQMLRQGDAGVFKRYRQAKLNMMLEALDRLDRRANNEHQENSGTAKPI